MNCLDIRRTLLADPRASSAEFSAHYAHCGSCRQFAARLSQDEALLCAAIAVAVPPQLDERILLHCQLRAPRRRLPGRLSVWSQPRRAVFAAAASMVLAFGLWWSLVPSGRPVSWSEVVLAHVIGEPEALGKTNALPRQTLSAALSEYGLTLKGELGTLRYFDHCALPGGRGVHAVIETPDLGKVTLVLPPIGTRAGPGAAQGEGYAAQILRVADVGVGVVTDRPERLEALTQRVHDQLGATRAKGD